MRGKTTLKSFITSNEKKKLPFELSHEHVALNAGWIITVIHFPKYRNRTLYEYIN